MWERFKSRRGEGRRGYGGKTEHSTLKNFMYFCAHLHFPQLVYWACCLYPDWKKKRIALCVSTSPCVSITESVCANWKSATALNKLRREGRFVMWCRGSTQQGGVWLCVCVITDCQPQMASLIKGTCIITCPLSSIRIVSSYFFSPSSLFILSFLHTLLVIRSCWLNWSLSFLIINATQPVIQKCIRLISWIVQLRIH